MVIRASRPKMPPAQMAAMIAVERPPTEAVIVIFGLGEWCGAATTWVIGWWL
jgi:hypothetical protein